jgi:apolipoprotein N-acyltransferase
LRWILGDIPAIAAEAGDFTAGEGGGLLAARGAKVGPLVCYESVFPSYAREAAGAGARVLVTMTNDSWFGWTHGPAQHMRHGLLRAHETGLPLLRAANTGISAIIDPRRPEANRQLDLGTRGSIVLEIGIPERPAPGVFVGRLVAIACATLSLAALVAALLASPPRTPAESESAEESVHA